MVEPEGPHKWHNMAHTICMLDKQGYMHAHASTRPPFRARAHTHKYVVLIAFPRQQRLRESASILRCFVNFVAGDHFITQLRFNVKLNNSINVYQTLVMFICGIRLSALYKRVRVIAFIVSIRPHVTVRLQLGVFLWDLVLGILMKSVQKNPHLVKTEQKYPALCILCRYQSCRWHKFAIKKTLCNTQYCYSVDSDKYKTHCCLSIATVVTRTRHNVAWYVHSASCSVINT
jgi:hypothetical protein